MLSERLKMLLKNQKRIITLLGRRGMLNWIPDKVYLKILYNVRTGKKLNLDNPQTFNEKLQWLKLYDRNPEYTKMVDKYDVKQYITERIGDEYIIPTLGVWEKFDDIDFDKLPDKFVLKCTHDSGGLVICRDKSKLDKEKAKRKIERSLRVSYFCGGREWPYKNLKPRIIAEQYMEQEGSDSLTDYKIFCFHGEPKIILTVEGGHEDESKVVRRMYDANWNKYEVGLHKKDVADGVEDKPKNLEHMLEIAAKLSAGIKHVRVDLYDINGRIYFGELTFFHMSGCEDFKPESWDKTFGDFLDLSK